MDGLPFFVLNLFHSPLSFLTVLPQIAVREHGSATNLAPKARHTWAVWTRGRQGRLMLLFSAPTTERPPSFSCSPPACGTRPFWAFKSPFPLYDVFRHLSSRGFRQIRRNDCGSRSIERDSSSDVSNAPRCAGVRNDDVENHSVVFCHVVQIVHRICRVTQPIITKTLGARGLVPEVCVSVAPECVRSGLIVACTPRRSGKTGQ